MDDTAPVFHPCPERLAAYASGWAAWPTDLCVQVHVETCAACQRVVAEHEVAEANFVDRLPDAPLPPQLLALAQKLAETPPPAVRPVALGDVLLPQALAEVTIASRRWVSPGFWVAPLRSSASEGWRTYILRAPAKQRLPAHGHAGTELICVLKGAFVDGATYRAGDFVEATSAASHEPIVASDGPCACLIASKGPLEARGLQRLITAALSI